MPKYVIEREMPEAGSPAPNVWPPAPRKALLAGLLLPLLLVSLVSCSWNEEVVDLHVQGRVTVDGVGVEGVNMEFWEDTSIPSYTTTDASGRYSFSFRFRGGTYQPFPSYTVVGFAGEFLEGGYGGENNNLCEVVDCSLTSFPFHYMKDLFDRHNTREGATVTVNFRGTSTGAPDAPFAIIVTPTDLELNEDDYATAHVRVIRGPDFTEEIGFALTATDSGILDGLNYTFTVADADPDEQVLTIQDVTLSSATYALTVEATSSSYRTTRAITLTVPEDGPSEPATGRIAFVSQSNIYAINPDGSGLIQLTDNDDFDYAPALSPDGSRIAFTSNRDGGDYDIYVMNSDGTNLKRLTIDDAYDAEPAWSPDGSQIVFTSNRGGHYTHLFVMNADGSDQPTRLSDADMEHNAPAWSPDGSRIAFTSYFNGYFDVFVINADGTGGLTNLTNTSYLDFAPAWSPDGTRIAFTSTRGEGEGNYDVYLMNADGSGVTRLTTDPDEDRSPAWSPDGMQIAFDSKRTGRAEIYIMNADGSGQVQVTDHATPDGSASPTWGPSSGPLKRSSASAAVSSWGCFSYE